MAAGEAAWRGGVLAVLTTGFFDRSLFCWPRPDSPAPVNADPFYSRLMSRSTRRRAASVLSALLLLPFFLVQRKMV
ncbi:hypothetical protein ACOMHN_047934 [Nucella lapillus]